MQRSDIVTILRGRFPTGEYVIMPEVPNATGGSASRTLDFVVMSMYPSRGLRIIGIERKSFRGDWLRELKNPAKQEPLFQYCDYFFLLTDSEDVAKIEEIPETWGWLTIKGSKVYTKKEAPKQVRGDDIPRSFVASLMRAGHGKLIHLSEIEGKVNEKVAIEVSYYEREMEALKKENKNLGEEIRAFEKSSGVRLSSWSNTPEQVGAALRLILENKLDGYESKFEAHLENAKRLYDSTRSIFEIIKKVNNEIILDTNPVNSGVLHNAEEGGKVE